MRRLLFASPLFLIPSAHALDYVECEATRSVISINSVQRQEEFKAGYDRFIALKTREKYGNSSCFQVAQSYSNAKYDECRNHEKSVWKTFREEGQSYRKNLKSHTTRLKRELQKIFKRKVAIGFKQ